MIRSALHHQNPKTVFWYSLTRFCVNFHQAFMLLIFSLTMRHHSLIIHAPMHGTSVVNGIEGRVNRHVRQKINSRNLIVNILKDFVTASLNIKIDVKLNFSRWLDNSIIYVIVGNNSLCIRLEGPCSRSFDFRRDNSFLPSKCEDWILMLSITVISKTEMQRSRFFFAIIEIYEFLNLYQ
jgi:hypothetical protein